MVELMENNEAAIIELQTKVAFQDYWKAWTKSLLINRLRLQN